MIPAEKSLMLIFRVEVMIESRWRAIISKRTPIYNLTFGGDQRQSGAACCRFEKIVSEDMMGNGLTMASCSSM